MFFSTRRVLILRIIARSNLVQLYVLDDVPDSDLNVLALNVSEVPGEGLLGLWQDCVPGLLEWLLGFDIELAILYIVVSLVVEQVLCHKWLVQDDENR